MHGRNRPDAAGAAGFVGCAPGEKLRISEQVRATPSGNPYKA